MGKLGALSERYGVRWVRELLRSWSTERGFHPVGASDAAPRAARGSFGHGAGGQGDGNGHGVMDAELRQAVRRTSAKRVTPGRDFTGR